jgi:agmatinase
MTDRQDQFLGEELQPAENDPATALFQLIPCPLEKTVSYGSGTAAGPAAILAASHQLERSTDGMQACTAGIFTQPPIACFGPIEQVLAELQTHSHALAANGHLPVILGGEHALSWAAVRGIREALPGRLGVVQIDAHADLRKAYQGQPHSHASVMQLLAEEGVPICQIGVRALSAEEEQARQHYGIIAHDGPQLVRGQISRITLPEDFPEQIYISFDLDGLDPAILPATGTPVPGGLGYYQALDLVASALDGRVCVGFDLVELAPSPAHPASDFCAAMVCYHLMGLALASRS